MNSNKISGTPPSKKDEIMENPLSPILNKKRYARKHSNRKPYKRPTESPGTSTLVTPQTSHIPIPIKEYKPSNRFHREHTHVKKENAHASKENSHTANQHHQHPIKTLNDVHQTSSSSLTNFKQEVITKCAKVGTICKFETVNNPISLSEGKLAKAESQRHKESKSESESKVIQQVKSKSQRYPQVFSNNSEVRCASGDISLECQYSRSNEANEDLNVCQAVKERKPCIIDVDIKKTQMLYENSKFLNEYSKTTVTGSVDSVIPVKVFCNNNFQSTDSSIESPKSPKCVKGNVGSSHCITEEDTEKEQQSQASYDIAAESIGTSSRHLHGKSKNQQAAGTSSRAEKTISKNIVNVKLTPSLKDEMEAWPQKVDKKTGYERNVNLNPKIHETPFYGFSSDDIENAEMVYQQCKNAYKAILRKKKKAAEFKAPSPPVNDIKSVIASVNTNQSQQNTNIEGIPESEKVDESILPPSSNRVQICIGNNRIKINIKADNNVEIGKIDSDSNSKSTELPGLTSDDNRNNSWGDDKTDNGLKKVLTVETQADFGCCAVETQADFRKSKQTKNNEKVVKPELEVNKPLGKQLPDSYTNTYYTENIEKHPDFSKFNNSPKRSEDFGGFNTASGKSITLNQQKVSAANALYNNINQAVETPHPSSESTDSKKNDEDYSTSGFKSGSGPQISSNKNEEFLNINLAYNTKKDKYALNVPSNVQTEMLGFNDSSSYHIVGNMLLGGPSKQDHNIRSPNKSNSSDSNCKNPFLDSSACGFQTASGNAMKLNQHYLNKVTKLYENLNGNLDYSETATSLETPSKGINYVRTEDTPPLSPRSLEFTEIKPYDNKLRGKLMFMEDRKFIRPKSVNKKLEDVRRSDCGNSTRKSLQFDEETTDHETIRECGNSTNLNYCFDTTGFASAAGRKINIDVDKLKNASTKFRDLDIPNIHESTEESNSAYNLNLLYKAGFASASGKQIKVDPDKLKNACLNFRDLETSVESSNTQQMGFQHRPGFARQQRMDADKLIKCKDMEMLESADLNFDHKAGFASASGRKIKVDADKLRHASAKFHDLNVPESDENSAESSSIVQKQNFDLKPEFASASGRKIKVDADKLRHASAKFYDLEIQESDDNSAESTNVQKQNFDFKSGFASAAGRKIHVNTDKLKNASAKFNGLEIAENILQDITDTAENEARGNLLNSPTNAKYTGRTAPELIKDVVNTYDKTLLQFISPSSRFASKDNQKDKNLDKEKDFIPVRPSISKKRLGMSRVSGVNTISKEKLEKARLLFEECDKNLTITPMKSFTNVKYNSNATTPRRDGPMMGNMTSTPLVQRHCTDTRNLDITPIKNLVVYDNGISNSTMDQITRQDSYEGTLLFRDKSVSNFQELQNDIDMEYMHLKRKLEVLEERKTALEEQKYVIDRCDNQHTRPRLGCLSIKKQNSEQRIQLVDLINMQSLKQFNIDPRIFEINSRNADKVHFNAAKNEFQAVVHTLDGAKVIPNTRNTIGVTEISNSFQAMSGVEPKLIPKGWVLNHYKWIVWKLACYERKFPEQFKDCLSVDNIMQQLKYRYDREIDQACRPALRKIMEIDDIPNKRLVLCVADIIQIFSNKFELLLTDGWYAIRTVIDSLLCQQIYTNKLTIGTKLLIQGAELLNCEGCHPLEAPEHVRLKIGYNNTRRAMWHVRLGYYKIAVPFPISLRTIHPDGGQIARIKVYIVRVYPLRFMEEYNGIKIWRNGKAEEKRARTFESDRMKELEKIKHKVYDDYEKSLTIPPNPNPKVDKQQLGNVTCPKLLYQIMEGSKDPESLYSLLNSKQKSLLMDYKMNIASERQRVIAAKMAKQLDEIKLSKRIVTPMLKLLVTDATEDSSKCMVLNVWRPNEEQMQMFQEESCMSVYNVMIKKTHELNTVRRTMFEIHEGISIKRTQRQLLPISMTTDPYYKPLFNEFDTIGIIIDLQINNYDQELWLADFVGRLLYVKIVDGPKICSLIDNAQVGQSVALCNLIMHLPHNDFGQAVANQFTTVSQFPKFKFLQNAIEVFNEQVNDLNKLINCCKSKIESLRTHVNLKSNDSYQDMSLMYRSNANMSMDAPSDENASIPSRLTEMDVAMSLLDTDQFL